MLLWVLIAAWTGAAWAQAGRGQLAIEVRDSSGAALMAQVSLVSEVNHISITEQTDERGRYVARALPFGPYRLTVSRPGFASADRLLEIRSEAPVAVNLVLAVAPVSTSVNVSDDATLINPSASAIAYTAGPQALREQLSAQPGRAITDVVNSHPGWLYEANGVLHPRGSEYGVQYVVDGIPETDNQSPSFAAPLESENANQVRVRTAGYPAEYGRRLGGVVEVNTPAEIPSGLHADVVAGGGSFASGFGYLAASYAHGANQWFVSGSGTTTDRYLDPPVLANYSNHGSFDGFTASYARDLTSRDRLRILLSHDQASFLVPNELVQQQAGQRQTRGAVQTHGQISYQRTLSSDVLFSADASVRDVAAKLSSSPQSVPIIAGQDRGFREAYTRLALAGQSGRHSWKLGADAIFSNVSEVFRYQISNPAFFAPDVAPALNFSDRGRDREQSAFVQDQVRLGDWNLSAGLRLDHYRLRVHDTAWSPRLALARYFSRLGMVVHASYDRVFETPAIENLLLASSPAVAPTGNLVRLPVEPARANFYELGFTKAVLGKISFTANIFRRDFHNYPDDDVFLNTGVSFPIAFAEAHIQGTEVRLEMPKWGRFSGYLSYSNQSGMAHGPITGGLLLGEEAIEEGLAASRFPVSQDQRNTLRLRLRSQVNSRVWVAVEGSWNSGLPVELEDHGTDFGFLAAQYGPQILSRVDFDRGRLRPSFSVDFAGGISLHQKDRRSTRLEAQISNLTNHLNLINFAGLFSGTALAPPRSISLKLETSF